MLLCGINRYWKILDENCRIFTKQFGPESSTELFDQCRLFFIISLFQVKLQVYLIFN